MLFARKGAKYNKRETLEPSNNDGQENPENLERQLRELFGEQHAGPQTPSDSTIARPVQIDAATSATRPVVPNKEPQTVAKPRSKAHTPNAQATPKTPKSVPSASSEQIGEILEDFSMEKAVIYSEILKPKYEEY